VTVLTQSVVLDVAVLPFLRFDRAADVEKARQGRGRMVENSNVWNECDCIETVTGRSHRRSSDWS